MWVRHVRELATQSIRGFECHDGRRLNQCASSVAMHSVYPVKLVQRRLTGHDAPSSCTPVMSQYRTRRLSNGFAGRRRQTAVFVYSQFVNSPYSKYNVRACPMVIIVNASHPSGRRPDPIDTNQTGHGYSGERGNGREMGYANLVAKSANEQRRDEIGRSDAWNLVLSTHRP